MRRNLYDVYENGKKIGSEMGIKEAAELCGAAYYTVKDAVYKNAGVYGRYTFRLAGKEKLKDDYRISIVDFRDEWNRTVKPFRNVKWVKNGGKRLRVQRKKMLKKMSETEE